MKKQLLTFLLAGLFVIESAFAQTSTVTGKVIGADDQLPLPGVSVRIKGTKAGTQTDTNGKYTINIPPDATTLIFTYIGYVTQEIPIGTRTSIDVQLVTDATLVIPEVVITGYTVTTREKFSGAASTISAKNIEQIPNPSFDQILQGRAPGLAVQAGSGQPGANNKTNVLIRGEGSINGETTPLYIMDGIPIESTVFSTVNSNDFETVTILKDASSTALYGSRGANGVIVISTKKGKAGPTNITYRTQFGFSNRTRPKFDMMTTAQRLQYELELGQRGVNTGFPGWALSKLNPSYANQAPEVQARRDFQLDSISKINTDWPELFFRTSKTQQHEIDISGGNEKTTFYTSLAYLNQEGIALKSKLERYNFRANIEHTTGRFTLGIQSAAGFSKSKSIQSEGGVYLTNPFMAVYLARPYENPFIYNGKIGTRSPKTNPLNLTDVGMLGNPLFDSRIGSEAYERLLNTGNNSNQFKGILGLNGRYKITDYLFAKSTTGFDFRETQNTNSVNPASYAGASESTGNQGSYGERLTRNFKFINTSGLEFTKTFNSKHDVTGQALVEYVRENSKTFSYTAYGIHPKLPLTPAGVSQGTETNNFIPLTSGGLTQRAILSFIALGGYTYDSKYTINASLRRDGSSLVPEQHRFRNFYSVGASWNMEKEGFMSKIEFLNGLKLRASYGVTANAGGFPADFNYLPSYNAITYAGTPAIAPGRPADKNYDWEYTYITNLGLDFTVFNNRARGYIDVYNKKTKNAFIDEGLSYTTGFGSLSRNAGEVQNRGIEGSFEVDLLKSDLMKWSINLNMAYNKNKVTSLGNVNELEAGTSIIRVGLPLGSHYTVKSGGVDPANGDALWVNKDGTITNVYSASQSVAEFGTSSPPFTGGFGTNVSYKGIDLACTFSFASGFKRYNNEVFFLTNSGQSQFNQLSKMLTNSWKKPGDIAEYSRYGVQRQFNSNDIEDSSYLRLRNITLGYTFPKTLIAYTKFLKSVRVYAQAQNLLTFTKWSGFDPEDNNSIAQFEYPAARTFTFGLDVNF